MWVTLVPGQLGGQQARKKRTGLLLTESLLCGYIFLNGQDRDGICVLSESSSRVITAEQILNNHKDKNKALYTFPPATLVFGHWIHEQK